MHIDERSVWGTTAPEAYLCRAWLTDSVKSSFYRQQIGSVDRQYSNVMLGSRDESEQRQERAAAHRHVKGKHKDVLETVQG
jgi:hypothetical protein